MPTESKIPLQPLRIPTGWCIEYNDGFYEVDSRSEFLSEEDRMIYFKEDMLQLRNIQRGILLDLGWYSEGSITQGAYLLVVYKGDFQGELLYRYTTNDRQDLTTKIEQLLRDFGS